MAKQRIQKVLAAAGVASRRAAEQLVLDGHVSVNSEQVTALPCFVEDGDAVRVDGRLLRVGRSKAHAYFLLNKSRGVVCTSSDPQGRPTAVEMIPPTGHRLFSVGRLDVDSSGVLILTDDGDLTQRLTHPRYGVPKTYLVQVDGAVTGEEIEKLKRGMYLDGSRTGGAAVRIVHRAPDRTMLELQLREGRNREVRRLLLRLGHKVRRLHRSAIGPLTDHGLKIGNFRALRPAEVEKLRRATGGDETEAAARPARRRRKPASGKSSVGKGKSRPGKRSASGEKPAAGKDAGKKMSVPKSGTSRRIIGG